jgi:phosphoenolpyruvate synthase/pyruvate phosphate dikinase
MPSLSRRYGEPATDVAVRSSATAEQTCPGRVSNGAAFRDFILNIGASPLWMSPSRSCFGVAGHRIGRSFLYPQARKGFAHSQVALSVGVQKDGPWSRPWLRRA